jgi:cold shock CspA family protein
MANQGSLKKYDRFRGFGFITCNGVDYFFHKSDINTTSNTPQDGDVLTFDMAPGPAKEGKKAKAINVTVWLHCRSTCLQGWLNSYETIWCDLPCTLSPGHARNCHCGREHFTSV